jgi:hypothetical protein
MMSDVYLARQKFAAEEYYEFKVTMVQGMG